MTILQVSKTIEEVLNLDLTKIDANDQLRVLSEMTAFAENTQDIAQKYSKDYDDIRLSTLNFFNSLIEKSD